MSTRFSHRTSNANRLRGSLMDPYSELMDPNDLGVEA